MQTIERVGGTPVRIRSLWSLILAVIVGAPAFVGTTTASAETGKATHEAAATFRLKLFDVSATDVTYVGTVEWALDGHKAQRGLVEGQAPIPRTTGTSSASGFQVEGNDRFYLPDGSVGDVTTGTTTLHSDGSGTTSYQGTFKGGTGRFRGAAGKFTATCSNPKASDLGSVTTCELRGTISG